MNEDTAHDPEQTPATEATPAGDNDAELLALRNERDALQDQLKRSLADLANIRRRHLKEMEQVRNAAAEALAAELLPVLDNFNLALEAHEQHSAGEGKSEAHALVEGLRMVRSLLEGTLERHGLREIAGHGMPFDPNVHEAVGLDTESRVSPGHVARVLQRGYYFGEKILRPSRVLVRDQSAGDKDSEARARND
ncbi:MAG: nucleotide exchange factor GrpE [Planctomycetota bacterium]